MHAIDIISATTSGSRIQLSECAIPQAQANQVLIKVVAAGVNRPDIMQRQGVYPPPVGASPILGLEVAGTVIAVAAGVTELNIGDEVCALVNGGGYAEYCVAEAGCCLPKPRSLNGLQAASLPETFFTVWSNVFMRGGLSQGETLLVHGGGSGIGVTAIQLAKAFGCKVFVTAGSAEKCEQCLTLGADAAINYRQQDFVDSVLQLTNGSGVNMVLDMVGGDYLPRNLKCLAEEGRLVQIAVQQGAKAELNLWQMMLKRLTLTGSTLRSRDPAFKALIAKQLQQQVWPLLESGSIIPVIDSVFPLAQAEAAHERMLSNQHFGKIILEI